MENGSTKPMRCQLSDGRLAVVKYCGNPEGVLVLINEWCSARIAETIGLPIPPYGLCTIDDEMQLSEVAKEEYAKSSLVFSPGTAFYSIYQRMAVPVRSDNYGQLDKTCLVRMILFDHIIYNKDRHEGNLLYIMSGKKHTFYAIDHSHVFKNQCIWNRHTFLQGAKSNDYRDTEILRSNRALYQRIFLHASPSSSFIQDVALQCRSCLTDEIVEGIIGSTPPAWIAGRESDVSALQTYLLYRIEHIIDIADLVIREGGLLHG